MIANGTKQPHERLWTLQPLSSTLPAVHPSEVNNVVHNDIDAEFVHYWHAVLGSPPPTTLLKALRHTVPYIAIPRLTARVVAQNLPHTMATAKGHLNLNRQGVRSQLTARQRVSESLRVTTLGTDDAADPDEDIPDNGDEAYTCALDVLHSDATGRFPVQSAQGNNYLLVSWYKGYLFATPLPNRQGASYVQAYRATYAHFNALGHFPKFQRLDNESSGVLERYLLANHQLILQKVPPNNHRANRAERAIQTYKNHMLSTLSTADKEFPLHLWDLILQQVNITVNLLRPFAANTDISAYEGIHGQTYDFVAHPMAPVGTKVLIHESPANRASWAPHGVAGYYLGPALDGHYRAFRVYVTATAAERITDTLAWFPAALHLPGSSAAEQLLAAITSLDGAMTTVRAQGNCDDDTTTRITHEIITKLKDLVPRVTSESDQSQQPVIVQPMLGPPPGLQRVNPAPQSTIGTTPSRQLNDIPATITATVGDAVPAEVNFPQTTARTRRKPARYGCAAAISAPVPSSALNLDSEGKPLTYRTAHAGPDKAAWIIADGEEISRLITSGTIRPIHRHQ
jgi:hypothetical protein